MTKTGRKNRIQSLDIIRGIAILMVIIHHSGFEMIPNQPEIDGATGLVFWSLKNLGWSGVDLFFVLSGFLIGGLLFSEIERTGTLSCSRFWMRRGFKIWPSYFALLFVLAVAEETRWIDLGSMTHGIRDMFVHGLFLQNYLDQSVNGPTWSLAVEEHFYLLLPVILITLHLGTRHKSIQVIRYHSFFALALIGGLSLRIYHVLNQGGPHIDDFMLTHFRFDSLILGVALQYYRRRHSDMFEAVARKYWWLLLPTGFVLLLPTLFYSRDEAFMFTIGFTGLSLGYAILLWLALTFGFGEGRVGRLLEPVAVVGRWSYNIYLWHYFAPLLIPGYWFLQTTIGESNTPVLPILVAQIVLYSALSIAIGALMTKLVENPMLKLRDKWFPAKSPVVIWHPFYTKTVLSRV
jgi:peptidoglycan/LPS O-acetylase OafA/YrhL